MVAQIIEALRGLLELLIEQLGPERTLVAILVVFALAVGWTIFNDWRRDRHVKLALKEKDRTIQRLAQQEREWRMYFMVSQGKMNRRTAEKIVLENDFLDAAEARKKLEEK